MIPTTEQVMAQIEAARQRIEEQSARSSSRESDFFSANSREVYKKVKSKKSNDISRECEETPSSEVSGETYLLAGGLSDNISSSETSSSLGFAQKAVDNIITPARTTTRELTGIFAQHARTKSGIKISLTIQTNQDAETGSAISLTAELKRHSRLRELKQYKGDSTDFSLFYIETVNNLKDLTPTEGSNMCMGRIHERGSRSAWFADMMCVGKLNEEGHMSELIFYYGSEEYLIEFNQELSPKQQLAYHSSGLYGEIRNNRPAPTLATARRIQL